MPGRPAQGDHWADTDCRPVVTASRALMVARPIARRRGGVLRSGVTVVHVSQQPM